jgi:acyl-CoA thioesterase FadM
MSNTMTNGTSGAPESRRAVTYSGFVHSVDCDLMGHLNTARSAAIFDSANWKMLGLLGYRWRPDHKVGWADVKNVILYEREVPVDSVIHVESCVSRLGAKSITLHHELFVEGVSQRCTSFDAVLVQFDLVQRVAVPIEESYRTLASQYLVPVE